MLILKCVTPSPFRRLTQYILSLSSYNTVLRRTKRSLAENKIRLNTGIIKERNERNNSSRLVAVAERVLLCLVLMLI